MLSSISSSSCCHANTLLRHDSQQTEKIRREIQKPKLFLLTQVRFSKEQSTLVKCFVKLLYALHVYHVVCILLGSEACELMW
jgi:hypothetical protein